MAISVLLTAQFGLLATSEFIPTANFGLMTAVGLLAGQAAELLLLPALLVMKDGRRRVSSGSSRGRLSESPRSLPVPRASETLWPPADAPAIAPAIAAPVAASGLLIVCRGEACKARGADVVWHVCLDAYVSRKARGSPMGAVPVESPCLRRCEEAPAVAWCAEAVPLRAADSGTLSTAAASAIHGAGTPPDD